MCLEWKSNTTTSSSNALTSASKTHVMAKYGKGAGEKVEQAMHEMKEGKLKTGSGKKVTTKEQAIAIGLSQAREEGIKVPKKEEDS
jgi:hypothetical protein